MNSYSVYHRFYLACYRGNCTLAKYIYESDKTILDSPGMASTCFYYSCIRGNLEILQWIASIVDTKILFYPYLLIDVCKLTPNIELIKWIYDMFPIDLALDNHFAFRCIFEPRNKVDYELVQWFISLRPYKYYVDLSGNGCMHSDADEKWSKARNAMLIFYRTNGVKDIWRKIISYL